MKGVDYSFFKDRQILNDLNDKSLITINNCKLEPSLSRANNEIFQFERIHDNRVLGHLPYNEIPREKLVLIEPNIEVHIDMRDSL